MIQSFRDRATRQLWNREPVKRFAQIERSALEKLRFLDAAISLKDIAARKGLRLETLRGDRRGQHSIRINDQYRICFRWQGHDAFDVEIVDYH